MPSQVTLTVSIVSLCVTAPSSLSGSGKQQLDCVRFTWFYDGADQQDIDLMDFTINYTAHQARHFKHPPPPPPVLSSNGVVMLTRQDCIPPCRFPAGDNGGSSPPPPPPPPPRGYTKINTKTTPGGKFQC